MHTRVTLEIELHMAVFSNVRDGKALVLCKNRKCLFLFKPLCMYIIEASMYIAVYISNRNTCSRFLKYMYEMYKAIFIKPINSY